MKIEEEMTKDLKNLWRQECRKELKTLIGDLVDVDSMNDEEFDKLWNRYCDILKEGAH